MRASKKVKGAVLLTAGAALFIGAPTVYADSNGGDGGDGGNACSVGGNNSVGNDGILGGAQVLNNANLNIPVTVAGVGALLAGGKGAASTTSGDCSGGSGGDGGNAKSKGDDSDAKGGNGGSGGNGASKGTNNTKGNDGILGGLQVGNNLTGNVPVTACGVGALLARGGGKCTTTAGNSTGGNGGNGGNAKASGGDEDDEASAKGGSGGDGGNAGSKGGNNSVDNDGLIGGAQVLNNADLNVPITLCGVALLAASAGCEADVSAGNNGGGDGGDGGNARVSGGDSEVGGMAVGGSGGDGGNGSSTGGNNSVGNDGILGGLQLLNNLDANVPVTVCGLAVLGHAGCKAIVSAGNSSGGDGGDGGNAVVSDDDGDQVVLGVRKDKHIKVVEGAHLPKTGAAGLALLPFGAALVAGGVALRRRNLVQR